MMNKCARCGWDRDEIQKLKEASGSLIRRAENEANDLAEELNDAHGRVGDLCCASDALRAENARLTHEVSRWKNNAESYLTQRQALRRELVKAWSDGYHAGIDDLERCEHRSNPLSRSVWKVTGNRLSIWPERGECFLYSSENPHEPKTVEVL